MTQTLYDVQGNPIARTEEASDETFTGAELDAIQICAANIDSIVAVAINGPTWLSQGQASAAAAANSAGAAANSATSSQNSATAADSSNVAAAASASAAATSAQNAATAASSATVSSNAAAVSAQTAQDAAASNTGNPALLPSGGNPGDTLYRDVAGGSKYGIWGPTRKILDDIDDVVYDTPPQPNDRLTFVSGAWKPRPGGSSSSLATLSDVALGTLVDGDGLFYELASTKWKNKQPAAGGTGSSFIRRDANLVGPLSYPMVTADLFGFKKGNVAAGDVELVFDGNIVTPVGQRGWGFVKVVGADGVHKVKFTAGSTGAPAAGTFGTPIFKQVSSAVSNTALTNAQNVAQAFTIPQGLKCSVAIVYCWSLSTGLGTDDSVSPGFIWGGNTASPETWDVHGDGVGTRMRGNLAWMYLGDIPAGGLATSFLPQWTDYGGNGRVNAYTVAIIPYYGSNPTPVEAANILQTGTGGNSAAIDQTCLASGISGLFREVVYVSARRSTQTADGGITYTNATAAGKVSSTPALQNGVAMAVAHEAAAASPTNNTAHAANDLGTTAYPWIDCSFAFVPVSGVMSLFSRNNKALEMLEPNQMCAWMYDQEQKIVELVF